MVRTQLAGDNRRQLKNVDSCSTVSYGENGFPSLDRRRGGRSKSYPHVRARHRLSHGTEGEGERIGPSFSVESLSRFPALRPESDDVGYRRSRILRKFGTALNASKYFWRRGSEDQTNDFRMEHWTKIRSTVAIGTVISRAFGENKEKRKIINPFKLKQELKKVS